MDETSIALAATGLAVTILIALIGAIWMASRWMAKQEVYSINHRDELIEVNKHLATLNGTVFVHAGEIAVLKAISHTGPSL